MNLISILTNKSDKDESKFDSLASGVNSLNKARIINEVNALNNLIFIGGS